jgi:AcrR family transcriptional regulator
MTTCRPAQPGEGATLIAVPPRTTVDHEIDTTRDALLTAASDLLASSGPDALTVRAIADRAGCSTMGVYTHFGGKDGVVEALFVEGFQRLGAALSSVPTTDDPLDDLRASCASYRRFALENPTHYIVMFERHVPGFEPSVESMVHAHATLVQLEVRVQRCLDAGIIDRGHGDAQEIAYTVWATGHGVMSLELHEVGKREDYEERYRGATATMFAGLTHPPLIHTTRAEP